MYKIEKIFTSLLSNVFLLFKSITNFRSFVYKFPMRCDSAPKIKIKSGYVNIGRISVRTGFNIFCEKGVINISDGCFFNNYCSINCQAAITIGKNTIMGEGVKIYDHDHLFNSAEGVSLQHFASRPITIGSGCWIGSNCVILKGVTICDNVAIGAGAIITKNIDTPGMYIYRRGSLEKFNEK